MTATETIPLTTTNTATWDAAFQALKARFPKAKDSIVFCVHALLQNPGASTDDLKAQALVHGLRVTAASVTAAQKLLAPTPAASAPTTADTASAPQRPARRVRPGEAALDAEALIRQMVGKLQNQGAAETQRLRGAVHKAITVLQAAIGS